VPKTPIVLLKIGFTLALATALMSYTSFSQAQGNSISAEKARVINHWTPERINKAIPRDLVIDSRGLGYLRKVDGSLEAYGRSAKPGGGDSTAPAISNLSPSDGTTIGSEQTFSAVITDLSGIKSVSFVVTYPNGTTTQSFTPIFIGSDTWSTDLSGFTDGSWNWHAVAKDKGSKGGNTATSASSSFTVDTGIGAGGGGGSADHIVTNAAWLDEGIILTAAGRIYFEMPANAKRKGPWNGYVCSGTVTTDETSGRSIIITASHCVYDDANKAFARNVLFIPNQDGTSGSGTDTNCSNDPIGCWVASFGVVDLNWATNTFPNNIAWDYAFYVVSDTGSHSAGASASSDSLDVAAGSLPVNFTTPSVDDGDPSATSADFTHGLGYSYSEDPSFMYCAEDMTSEGTVNWWLANCGLSGGASGGPWVQPINELGTGPIISVNSWGYTESPGMAGPKLANTSAECLYTEAKYINFALIPTADGEEGVVIDPNDCE